MSTHSARSPSTLVNLDAIAEAVGKDVATFLRISSTLNLDEQDLPAIVRILLDAGQQFAGSNAIDAARDWLDEGFDCDQAREWVKAGFWSAYTAAKLYHIGIDAREATAIADALVYRGFDGDPISGLCDGRVGLETFVLTVPDMAIA